MSHRPYVVAGLQFLVDQRGRTHRRVADGFRVVGHHRDIVQRMNEFHLARHFDGAIEGNAYIPHGHRDGIAVHDHQTPLGIDDQTRAVIILFRDAGDGIGHIEGDHHQRRRQPIDARVAGGGELRGGRRYRRGQGPRLKADAGPNAERVITLALARREPASIHADDFQLSGARILQRDVLHRCTRAVGQARECRFEIRQRVHFLAVEGTDERAVRYARAAEHIAGIGDIYALDGQIVVPRLLVRQRMHHRLAEFDVFVGSNGAQGFDVDRMTQRGTATLDLDLHRTTHRIVEHILEREEFRYRLTIDAHQDIAGAQHAIRGGARLHIVHHQHAGKLGVGLAHARFGVGIEAEPAQFIVRRVLEYRLERTPRHRLARVDELQRPHHRRQGQVETGLRPPLAPPALSATTRPSTSITGEPDEPPEVPEAA